MSFQKRHLFHILTVVALGIPLLCYYRVFQLSMGTFRADDVNRDPSATLQQSTYVMQNSSHNTSMHTTPSPCIDRHAYSFQRVEDIFCVKLPPFLPHLKNPCFYDLVQMSKRKLRCLPYFFIIGMDKSATTDQHNRLRLHPDVRGNRGTLGKEVGFWSWKRYGFGARSLTLPKVYLKDYLNSFEDTSMELERNQSYNWLITGDATPMDMWDYRGWDMIPQNFGKAGPRILTPDLLKQLYKDRSPPKMLIQLREPVERLYSDYIFLRMGQNPDSFHHHVVKSVAIMDECVKNKSELLCYSDKGLYRRLPTRIHLGCYSIFLREWLRVFPLSAFHVTRTEDFHQRMNETLQDIFSYLKLASLPDKDLQTIINKSRKYKTSGKKGEILPETVAILRKFYRPCLEETASLFNDSRFLWEDIYALRSSKADERGNQTIKQMKKP